MAGGDPFERILSAAQAGDGRAFGALYLSFNRRVHAYLAYRGALDLEGMVNDVFLKVFMGLADFCGGESQFAAWVFTIARNTLIDETRRRERRGVEVPLRDSDPLEGPIGDVENEALGRLGHSWVVEALGSLTPDQRDVIVLRVVGDLSVESVAGVLGKGPEAVKALQRRALRTLERISSVEGVPK